jgi:RNA polymerase sigma factor (sigma-70 family)
MNSMLSLSDMVLMKSISEGSEAAFRELYDRYWTPLYRMAYNRVGEDAKDIIQEIMIGVWQRKDSIRAASDGSLAPYLFTALKYRIIRHYAYTATEIRNNGCFDVSSGIAADQELEYRELASIIEVQISNMPPRMQQIFRMSREEGISIAAIASRLSLSEQTVKNQLSAAMKHLRLNLDANDIGDWALLLTWFFWAARP